MVIPMTLQGFGPPLIHFLTRLLCMQSRVVFAPDNVTLSFRTTADPKHTGKNPKKSGHLEVQPSAPQRTEDPGCESLARIRADSETKTTKRHAAKGMILSG